MRSSGESSLTTNPAPRPVQSEPNPIAIAPLLYANDGAKNVQLSTGMRFLDGNGAFPPSIRCISHIMKIYTLKGIRLFDNDGRRHRHHMDIRNMLGQISDRLDENEQRRTNMDPSRKWMMKALNPVGYAVTVIAVCIIWLMLGGIATRASQANGFFAVDSASSLAVFAAGMPALAVITVIARAAVCLAVSGVLKLIEKAVRFVKRL